MISNPLSHMILWSRGLVKSYGKLKSLYLQYGSAYGHQTWQDSNLPCWATAHKVRSLYLYYHSVYGHKTKLDKLVTCHEGLLSIMLLHVTNYNHYISTATISMATKLGRMVTHLDCLLSIKSNEHIITWFCEITWQTKTFYLHYHNAYSHRLK